MIPGDVKTLYRLRRLGLFGLAALPVLGLAGVYWLVTQVVLVPRVPGPDAPGAEVAHFVMHAKGLPRLSPAAQVDALVTQMSRLRTDGAFRDSFLAAVRTAGSDAQRGFRQHLFDAFKVLLVRDAARFEQTPIGARETFLDDRIVFYNRLGMGLQADDFGKVLLAAVAPTRDEGLALLMQRTDEQERELVGQFLGALRSRAEAVLADAQLKAAIEARIAGP